MTTTVGIPLSSDVVSAARDVGAAGGQTRAVLAWKAIEYVGLALFTVLVPRLMGPERYGSFAAVLGTVGLITLLSGMGAQATLGRFVPEYQAGGRPDRVRQIFTQIFGARLVVGGLLGGALMAGLPRLLPEATTLVAAAAGATVLAAATSLACYQLSYGLNHLSRWLVRDALVRPVVVVLLLLLGGSTRLEAAVLALLGAEIGFLALGLAWAAPYLSGEPWEGGWRDLAGHLRFGLTFFGANVLLMAVWRGGEVTVLLLGAAREQVGFYNIANAIAMAFGALIGQLAATLVPRIATLHVAGDGRRADAWLAYSLKYLTICTFAFVLVVDAAGDTAVTVLLGAAYLPVVTNLKVLAVGLLPLALVRTAVSQAMIWKEPGRAVAVAGAGLLAFVVLAVALVPRLGALGASISVAGAVAGAGLAAYRQFALGNVLGVARFWRVVLAGSISVVVASAPGLPGPASATLALLLFPALLFRAGALTLDELRRVTGALMAGRGGAD